MRLTLKSGRCLELLLHVEVESQRPSIQMRRLATLRVQQYDYRIHDRYVLRPALRNMAGLPSATVHTLVIFTRGADGPDWLEADHQPLQNEQPLRYRAVYLGRWLARWPDLSTLAQTNPFAMVIMAQLLAHRHPKSERLPGKVGLVRNLMEANYAADDSISLLRLIDWMLTLPVDQHESYARTLEQIQKEIHVPFVMTHERVYTKRGIVIGQSTMLQDQIEHKFGPAPDWVRERLSQADARQLRTLSRRILAADSLQSLFPDTTA